MRIFNRATQERHPLFRVLEKMSRGTDEQRAVACNCMHDPRVSNEREEFFLGTCRRCENPRDFIKLLDAFRRKYVQQTASPDFENSYNVYNRIFAPAQSLVNIFVVNGLSRMFLWAKEFSRTEMSKLRPRQRRALLFFTTYPNHADPHLQDSLDFVSEAMHSKTRRREFLELIFVLYDIYRVTHPYHPIWLTKWSDFRIGWNTRASDRANRWCHRVGISTEKKTGQWVAVLHLSARHLMTGAYHPTILDAGANVYHFPAPEGVSGGGRAADLRNEWSTLACEYIAAWPGLGLAWIDFSRGCGQLKGVSQKTIKEIRRHHIRRLREEFQRLPSALSWLKRVGSF